MKKLVSILSVCALMLSGAVGVMAEDDIKVIVDSKPVVFDQQPVIQDGRTLVPMRAIFEAMGCTVDWEAASQKVTASNSAKTITMNINNVSMRVAEDKGVNTVTLDVPPQIIGGRTLVPVRAISEALGANVAWDGNTRTVTVSSITYLYKLKANDGRREGAAKGNLAIENRSLKLSVDKSKATDGANESASFAEYQLDGRYATLAADVTGTQNTAIRIFADGNKVYDSEKGLSKGGLPLNVNVNISGCKTLRIEAYGRTGTASGYIQLDNARVIG